MEEDLYTIDLAEIFTVIKNNILLIICATLLFGTVGFCYSKFLITEQFEANATMIVNTRQEQNTVITYDQINSARQLLNTYAVILKSDTVLDKVINNLKLNEKQGYEKLTAETMAKSIVKISQVDDTQVMKITAKTSNPEVSQQIVSEIVKLAPNTIIEKVKAGSVEVISAPKANYEKVSPSNLKNTAICAFIGLVLSAGGVILLSIFDNTFNTDEDISKKLDITVLGVIPKIYE